jgi:Protein of unknown function (DUF1264)
MGRRHHAPTGIVRNVGVLRCERGSPRGNWRGRSRISDGWHDAACCAARPLLWNPRSQEGSQVSIDCAALLRGAHREANAKLLGVEYIISDREYRKLPEGEKQYWHPHTYEVLGGGLIAPGMPEEEERKFMQGVMTTWGKTWHTWPDPRSAVPIGEPLLIWSLMGDGQADERVVAERDRQFNVSTSEIRKRRGEQIGLEAPQVALPRTLADLGRQRTNSGDDKPTPRK